MVMQRRHFRGYAQSIANIWHDDKVIVLPSSYRDFLEKA